MGESTSESGHARPVVLRRTNRALALAVPIWIVGRVALGPSAIATIPSASIFALGLVSSLLFVEWLVVRTAARLGALVSRGAPPQWAPALPFFERASAGRRPWLALGVLALLVTCAREHVLGDALSITYEHFDSTTQTERHVDTATSSRAQDGEAPELAGRPAHCFVSCTGAPTVCVAARAAVRCADDYEPGTVQVNLTLSITGDDCSWMPWLHDGTTRYHATGTLDATDDAGYTSVWFDVTGTVERHAVGFHSCVAFDEARGHDVGDQVASALEATLEAN